MARYSEADMAFFDLISDNVTSSNALPFQVPIDRFPAIVVKASKYFWEWKNDATQEYSLAIPASEIQKHGKDRNGNTAIQLPSGIEGISQAYTTGDFNFSGLGLKDILRISLLDAYNTTTPSVYGGDGYQGGHTSVSDTVIAMYEYSMYDSLLSKPVQFSFNRLTSKINLLGNIYGRGLVLHCFVRVQPEYLYNDWTFEEYVTACVNMELGKIVMSIEMPLVGNARINYDQIRSDGQDRKREIEQELRQQPTNTFILKK